MTKLVVVLFGLALAGCTRDAQPRTYAIPTASAGEIKTALCPPHGPAAEAMTGCHDGDEP